MKRWEKAKTTPLEFGGRIIKYTCSELPVYIESRRQAVPHANRQGFWMHTSYFVMDPRSGKQKEYQRLKTAQEAAEEMFK